MRGRIRILLAWTLLHQGPVQFNSLFEGFLRNEMSIAMRSVQRLRFDTRRLEILANWYKEMPDHGLGIIVAAIVYLASTEGELVIRQARTRLFCSDDWINLI